MKKVNPVKNQKQGYVERVEASDAIPEFPSIVILKELMESTLSSFILSRKSVQRETTSEKKFIC